MAQQSTSIDQSLYGYASTSYPTPSGSGSFSGGPTAHQTAEEHRSPSERGSESEDVITPPKKKRKRQALSCTECKRRKIKCDRVQPCTPCTRRGEPAKCRWHIVEPTDKYVLRSEHEALKARIQVLEDLVQRLSSATSTGQTILPSIASPLTGSPSQGYSQQGYFQEAISGATTQQTHTSHQRYTSREIPSPQLSRANAAAIPHPLNTSTSFSTTEYPNTYGSPASPHASQRRSVGVTPTMNLPSRQSSSLVPPAATYGHTSSLYTPNVTNPGPFHSTQMENPKNADAQMLMTLGEYLRQDAGPATEDQETRTVQRTSLIISSSSNHNSNHNNRHIDTSLAEAHSRAMFREISNSHNSITNNLTRHITISTKK